MNQIPFSVADPFIDFLISKGGPFPSNDFRSRGVYPMEIESPKIKTRGSPGLSTGLSKGLEKGSGAA